MDCADGLPLPRRIWAILTITLGIMLSVLDSAIANVALPTIARDIGASPAASIWVVNAYQLTITVSMLALASLGDIVSYRRVYRVGLAVFTLASVGCAFAQSLPMLSAARVIQGLGAAGLMSVSPGLLRYIYPRAMLGRGVGINALVVALSAAAGPSIASAILAVAPWPWLFAVNVPVGVAAFAVSHTLPGARGTHHAFDGIGAILNAMTFGLLILGIDGLGGSGEMWRESVLFAGALGAGFLLVRRQLTQNAPLLPLDLLRRPAFALAILTSICSFTAQMLAFVPLPFLLQGAMGRTQVEAGLLMTPWPVAVGVVAPLAGRLADRYPVGLLTGIGSAALAMGMAALALLPAHPATVDIAWRMALCGAGFALFQAPNNRAILGSVPRGRSGAAGGMLGMARLLGQSCGTALVGVLFARYSLAGPTVALWAGAGFSVVALLFGSLRLAEPRKEGLE